MIKNERLKRSYEKQVTNFKRAQEHKLKNISQQQEEIRQKIVALHAKFDNLTQAAEKTKAKEFTLTFEEYVAQSQIQSASAKIANNKEFDLSMLSVDLQELVAQGLREKGYRV